MFSNFIPKKSQLLLPLFVGLPLLSYGSQYQIYREISPIDSPAILTRQMVIEKNLHVLERSTARNVSLNLQPWANRSWKMNAGLIGARYADSEFATQDSWNKRWSYVQENSVQKILAKLPSGGRSGPLNQQRSNFIDRLSPAEKYDLLVGDRNGSLMKAQWAASEKYVNDGTLASWMGICEGTAAAGALYPEPLHAVDFSTADGDLLRFHVMDIKGLAGLLWSSYNAEIPIAGSRCQMANPKTDANGIGINEACFNSNPASFHLAILNYLGLHQRPFFMNRVPNLEVWNVPILEYKVQYYKPTANRMSDHLQDALLPIGEYPQDPFKKYRSSQAAHIVSVLMEIRISNGSTSSRDNPEDSKQTHLKYLYDLELDSSGNIVGGEWHQRSHPDFIWAVDEGFRPLSIGDNLIGAHAVWDGGKIPESWLGPIQQASSRNQPLEKIVTKLIELSRR